MKAQAIVKEIVANMSQYPYEEIGENEVVLYKDRKIREDPVLQYEKKWLKEYIEKQNKEAIERSKDHYWKPHIMEYTKPEDAANQSLQFSATVKIEYATQIFERDVSIKCKKRKRKINWVKPWKNRYDDKTNHELTEYEVTRQDWEDSILSIVPTQEKKFYLKEEELLQVAWDLLKEKYDSKQFLCQKKIGDRIADGLAITETNGCIKIIAFEVKTDRDNYNRLYDQLSEYSLVADELYLVLNNKEPPPDLPFNIGVIRANHNTAKVERRAKPITHHTDLCIAWQKTLKLTATRLGLLQKTPLHKFFDGVENIKRKMLWNQLVVGYRDSWDEKYKDFTDEERDLVKAFFSKDAKKYFKQRKL